MMDSPSPVDVVVIGAYLTGCATARAVAESLGVTTQEKRHGTV